MTVHSSINASKPVLTRVATLNGSGSTFQQAYDQEVAGQGSLAKDNDYAPLSSTLAQKAIAQLNQIVIPAS